MLFAASAWPALVNTPSMAARIYEKKKKKRLNK
jgi:hypothetical protein